MFNYFNKISINRKAYNSFIGILIMIWVLICEIFLIFKNIHYDNYFLVPQNYISYILIALSIIIILISLIILTRAFKNKGANILYLFLKLISIPMLFLAFIIIYDLIKNNRQYNYNYSPQLSVCISITIIIYSCYFGLIDLSKNKNKAEHDFSEKYDGNEFYKLKLNYSKIEITNNILFLKGKVLKKDVYKKVCKVENINLSLPCLIINVFLYASSIIILIFINTLPSEGNEHLYPILVLTALWSLTTIIFMLLSFKSAYFLPVYFTFKKRGGLWLVLNFFSKNNLPIFKSLNNTLYDIHNKTEFKVKNNKELLVKFSNKDQIGIISKNNNIDWQLIGQNTYIIKYEDTMDVFKIISIITLSIFKGGV